MKKYKILLTLVWGLIVIGLSIMPGSSIPKVNWIGTIHADKIAHFCFYFIWMCLLAKNTRKSIILSFLFLAFMGIGLEYIQGNFILNRTFSTLDILFNLLGVLTSAMLCKGLKGKVWKYVIKSNRLS